MAKEIKVQFSVSFVPDTMAIAIPVAINTNTKKRERYLQSCVKGFIFSK